MKIPLPYAQGALDWMYCLTADILYMDPYSPCELFLLITTVCVSTVLFTSVYRLLFHPLRQFPGPRLAAVSQWYQFYHDVCRGGKYLSLIPQFERQYDSKIIRIGPNHLHINDPDFFHRAYSDPANHHAPFFWEKLPWPNAMANITDPRKHALERRLFNPSLTGSSLDAVMPTLREKLEELGEILREHASLGQTIQLEDYFLFIAICMVSEISFGRSGSLKSDRTVLEETSNLQKMFNKQTLLFQYFPLLSKLIDIMPICLLKRIIPGYAIMRSNCERQIHYVRKRRAEGKYVSDRGQQTVCDAIMDCPPERHWQRLDDEYIINTAIMFSFGGTTGVAHALHCAAYHLLTHRDVLEKLKLELKGSQTLIKAWDFKKIEELPYLTAVIHETLRLTPPVPGFLPIIIRNGGSVVDERLLPKETNVSITQASINRNPDIFPDPETFRPERWMGESGISLDKWIVAFGKGRNNCIGKRLGYAQVYGCLAYLFLEFDLELEDSEPTPMRCDSYLTAVYHNSVTVKVKVQVKGGN